MTCRSIPVKRRKPLNNNRLDLSGKRFGRIVVIEYAGSIKSPCGTSSALWSGVCDCGNKTTTRGSSLNTGRTQSCGCLQRERTGNAARKHGYASKESRKKNNIYNLWQGMITRCKNKNIDGYANYGGRGIKVCARWHTFQNFYDDIGDMPAKNYSLEREDNNKGYTPCNTFWATKHTQSRNKRNNRMFTTDGKTQCMADWAKEIGICTASMIERLDKWPLKRALTEPKNGAIK